MEKKTNRVAIQTGSTNNEEVIDFDKQVEKKDDFKAYLKKLNANEVKLGGEVINTELIKGNAVMKDGVPVMDNLGNQRFYKDKYQVTIAYKGGEATFPIDEKLFDTLLPNENYLFVGRVGEVSTFGNVHTGIKIQSAFQL
ncbi:MAG: hypothetical protein PHG81_12890 [Aliarcobacter sp.]|nr:hypothetical protein [Aliarcobacter sp.]